MCPSCLNCHIITSENNATFQNPNIPESESKYNILLILKRSTDNVSGDCSRLFEVRLEYGGSWSLRERHMMKLFTLFLVEKEIYVILLSKRT